MFCTNCGNQIPDGTPFCTNCGAQQPMIQTPPPVSLGGPPKITGGPPPRRASPIPQSSLPIKSLPLETVHLLIGAGVILIIAGIVLLAVGYNMGSDWRRITSAYGTSSNIRDSWEPPSPEEKSAQTGNILMWVGGFAVLLGIALSTKVASTNRQQKEAQDRSELATHKTCPFCSERILSSAIKCRHCGSNLKENRNK